MIKGIHHISMKCQNDEEYSKVRSFYAEILQLSVVKECDACILLDTGAGIVEIFRDGTEFPEKGVIRHFAFAVDDVQACVDAVEAAGYEVFIAPKTVNIGGDSSFPATIAFCYGPLGEEIEFFCQGW
ncbi:MAG: VOC family protein [Ruminococcus sp.]|nr:VOC family protein [Ruminococcus sp.]